MRKRAAHVVALAATRVYELAEVGYNEVVASVSLVIYAEAVVDFLSAVKAQDHIVALAVGPLDDFIRDTHSVCGQCEAEVFVLLLLNASCIRDELLADFEVHEGLSAKKVHFQIPSETRVLHQKVQRPLAGLKAHEPR